ncbi:hypothetical protein C8R46DRAFT_1226614 [Mycena filopes]|nr:hypothetical protein C8R46DRAFT_1226614 [Mycena filopes]
MEGSEFHKGERPLYEFDFSNGSVKKIQRFLIAIHAHAVKAGMFIIPEPKVLVRRLENHAPKPALRVTVTGFIHPGCHKRGNEITLSATGTRASRELIHRASLSKEALDERMKRWLEWWPNDDKLEGPLFPQRDQVLACIELGVRVFPVGCLPQLRDVRPFLGPFHAIRDVSLAFKQRQIDAPAM